MRPLFEIVRPILAIGLPILAAAILVGLLSVALSSR